MRRVGGALARGMEHLSVLCGDGLGRAGGLLAYRVFLLVVDF